MKYQKIIKNEVFEGNTKHRDWIIIYRDRIKINNKRYNELYEVFETDRGFIYLTYIDTIRSFNYREIFYTYNNIYKIHGLRMKFTGYKIPENY